MTLYLSAPARHDFFRGGEGYELSEFDKSRSLYEFDVFEEDDEQKAYFRLSKDYNAKQVALMRYDERIEYACKPINEHSFDKTKSVITTELGIAAKQADGNWRVEKKAKIKYTDNVNEPEPELSRPKFEAKPKPAPERKPELEPEPKPPKASPASKKEIETSAVERSKEIFYFANPVGSAFSVGLMARNADGALYRFERFAGEGKASVFVIDEPRVVKRLTERPEAHDGVCDDGGNFNQEAKRIEVFAPGVAVLEGKVWRVTQKVKIKYIPSPTVENRPPVIIIDDDTATTNNRGEVFEKVPAKASSTIYIVLVGVFAIGAIVMYFLTRPSVETLFNKGKEQFDAKNYTEAAAYFSKAIKQNPGDAEIRDWRGRAYIELNSRSLKTKIYYPIIFK
jgi:tetratricopeptide (TPR) repeat protein